MWKHPPRVTALLCALALSSACSGDAGKDADAEADADADADTDADTDADSDADTDADSEYLEPAWVTFASQIATEGGEIDADNVYPHFIYVSLGTDAWSGDITEPDHHCTIYYELVARDDALLERASGYAGFTSEGGPMPEVWGACHRLAPERWAGYVDAMQRRWFGLVLAPPESEENRDLIAATAPEWGDAYLDLHLIDGTGVWEGWPLLSVAILYDLSGSPVLHYGETPPETLPDAIHSGSFLVAAL